MLTPPRAAADCLCRSPCVGSPPPTHTHTPPPVHVTLAAPVSFFLIEGSDREYVPLRKKRSGQTADCRFKTRALYKDVLALQTEAGARRKAAKREQKQARAQLALQQQQQQQPTLPVPVPQQQQQQQQQPTLPVPVPQQQQQQQPTLLAGMYVDRPPSRDAAGPGAHCEHADHERKHKTPGAAQRQSKAAQESLPAAVKRQIYQSIREGMVS